MRKSQQHTGKLLCRKHRRQGESASALRVNEAAEMPQSQVSIWEQQAMPAERTCRQRNHEPENLTPVGP